MPAESYSSAIAPEVVVAGEALLGVVVAAGGADGIEAGAGAGGVTVGAGGAVGAVGASGMEGTGLAAAGAGGIKGPSLVPAGTSAGEGGTKFGAGVTGTGGRSTPPFASRSLSVALSNSNCAARRNAAGVSWEMSIMSCTVFTSCCGGWCIDGGVSLAHPDGGVNFVGAI